MDTPVEHVDNPTTPTATYEDTHASPLQLDFSGANDFCDCERYYYNKYHLGVVPVGTEFSPSLLIGDAIHQALAVLSDSSVSLGDALSLFDSVYTEAYEREGCTDTVRTPYVGRSMLCAWFQKWGRPNNQHTEVGISIDMGPFVFYGKLDEVWADEYNTICDHKTTSSLMWLPQPRLNWQLIGYTYAAHELIGVDSTQVCVDGIVFPRISKKMQTDPFGMPPEAEFALSQHDNLHRRTAPVHPRDYAEWQRWIYNVAARVHHAIEFDTWPMRAPKACTRYNRQCEYDPLCKATSDEVEQRLRESLYVVHRWHPYEDA